MVESQKHFWWISKRWLLGIYFGKVFITIQYFISYDNGVWFSKSEYKVETLFQSLCEYGLVVPSLQISKIATTTNKKKGKIACYVKKLTKFDQFAIILCVLFKR